METSGQHPGSPGRFLHAADGGAHQCKEDKLDGFGALQRMALCAALTAVGAASLDATRLPGLLSAALRGVAGGCAVVSGRPGDMAQTEPLLLRRQRMAWSITLPHHGEVIGVI